MPVWTTHLVYCASVDPEKHLRNSRKPLTVGHVRPMSPAKRSDRLAK